MKLSRKLIPAFAMLLISAIMMTTASYAWFAINSSSDIGGMSVKTTAADSVVVAESTLAGTSLEGEASFKTDLSFTLSDKKINPVSTVDGASFFYVNGENVEGNGDAKSDTYVAYAEEAFNTAYGTTGAVGYVDYVFQVKATNAKEVEKSLNLSALTLTYSGAADKGQKAFRVAMFVETPTGAKNDTFTGNLGTLVTILAPNGATNYTENKAVAGAAALGEVTYGTAATIGSVAAGSTGTYKVVIRLWLEGEDTTCTNETFVDLAEGTFALNLTVAFDEDAVTKLETAVTPAS